MSRYFLVIFILFSFQLNGFGQDKATTTITGIVKDTLGNNIQYATIQILSQNVDSLRIGAITNAEGMFSVNNIPIDTYSLTISCIGYKHSKMNFSVSGTDKLIDLGSIILSEDVHTLDGIEVHGAQSGLKAQVDKTIYIPDSKTIKSSATGLDLLAKISGIKVKAKDQSISVGGSSNVMVLVNGVSNDRSISTIKSNDIERVEIIRNPSVTYESDVENILNIVLKEKIAKGIRIVTNLEYSFINVTNNSNAQIDYLFDRFRLFLYYGVNLLNEKNITLNSYRLENENDNQFELFSNSHKTKYSTFDSRIQYGIDYNLNKKNILSFTGNYSNANQKDFNPLSSNQFINGSELISSNSHNKNIYTGTQHNYNLYYLKKFAKPMHELKINNNLYFLQRNRDDLYTDSTFYYPDMVSNFSSRHEVTTNSIVSINSKADYSYPITESLLIKGGVQLYLRKIDNHYKTSNSESSLNYSDIRKSAYTDFTFNQNKFTLQMGVRAEQLKVNIYDTITKQQLHLLPSFSTLFTINKINKINLTYNRRLSYPRYLWLIPFEYYAGDSMSVSSGNPNLKPEKRDRITIKYSYEKNDFNLSTSFYFTNYRDMIDQVYKASNGVLSSQWQNINSAKKYGVEISQSSSLLNIIDISVDVDLSYTSFPNSIFNGFTTGVTISSEIALPADISAGIEASYYGTERSNNGYIYMKPCIDNIYITKTMFHQQGHLSFVMVEPFLDRMEKFKNWGADFSETTSIYHKSSAFLLRFTYFFSKGKKSTKVNKERLMEDVNIK